MKKSLIFIVMFSIIPVITFSQIKENDKTIYSEKVAIQKMISENESDLLKTLSKAMTESGEYSKLIELKKTKLVVIQKYINKQNHTIEDEQYIKAYKELNQIMIENNQNYALGYEMVRFSQLFINMTKNKIGILWIDNGLLSDLLYY